MTIGQMRTVAPSKISMWQGTRVEGSEFTKEQRAVLDRERPTWTKFKKRSVKLLGPEPRDPWEERETIIIYCPIIAWTKDKTRVLIVTPAGDKHWTSAEVKGE